MSCVCKMHFPSFPIYNYVYENIYFAYKQFFWCNLLCLIRPCAMWDIPSIQSISLLFNYIDIVLQLHIYYIHKMHVSIGWNKLLLLVASVISNNDVSNVTSITSNNFSDMKHVQKLLLQTFHSKRDFAFHFTWISVNMILVIVLQSKFM